MSRVSLFFRSLRIVFILVILFTFAVQAPGVGSAQTGIPETETPVDTSLPGPVYSEAETLPDRPVASGPDDMADYTIFDENGQPLQPQPDQTGSVISIPPGDDFFYLPSESSGDYTAPQFSDGSIDSTQPDTGSTSLLPYAPVTDQALESVPQLLDPSQDASLSPADAGVESPDQVNMLSNSLGNLDDFNRPNGSLGASWAVINGAFTINNNLAQTALGNTTANLAVYNGIGVNSLEADISIQPGGNNTQYTALVLNLDSDTVANDLFIKVQDNNKDGLFDTGGCYRGNNAGEFGLGFFNLTSAFASAHMRVEVSTARTVTLTLSQINGGSASQTYVCNGAPAFEGVQVGIGSYGGGRIDNLSTTPASLNKTDSFSLQNGPLGSDWRMRLGSVVALNGRATSMDQANNIALKNGLGSTQVEGDISLTPGGGVQYSALMLNYDEGVDNLFIKFQDNNGNGDFESLGCYRGNNSGAFAGGGLVPVDPFTSAHMRIYVGALRYVFIYLTNINGGSGSVAWYCTSAPGPEGYGVGLASWGGGRIDNFQIITNFEDDFSRPNGALGSDWTVRDGTYGIFNQTAQGTNTALATYKGLATSEIEGDVSLSPGGGTQYSGFVLDYGAGVNNIFVKAQDNDGNGQYDHAACYTGNNVSPGFGLGYFTLSSPFTTAHLRVSVDAARNVTIILSRINGGTGVQIYTCAGAPAAEGDQAGIVGYGNGRIDNVHINRTIALDQFNHPDGPIGPTWSHQVNNYSVENQLAVGGLNPVITGLVTLNGITGNAIEGDVSLSPGGGTQFAGFFLNYNGAENYIFLKVQDNNGDGTFDSGACYRTTNDIPFGLGFFSLSGAFTTAHMRVSDGPNHNVTILLTRINGGTGAQVYTCTGAPQAAGTGIGMTGYGGGRVDNVVVVNDKFKQIFLPRSAR
jgi:hypothetical protein